jgi:hypothetical protein
VQDAKLQDLLEVSPVNLLIDEREKWTRGLVSIVIYVGI